MELEKELARPDFWADQKNAQKITKERKTIENVLTLWNKLEKEVEDCHVLLELAREGADEEIEKELEQSTGRIEQEVTELEFKRMLSGENRLEREYPEAKCALEHADALELVVATILSAQCTDARVNQVTPALFRRCPTAADYAAIPAPELEALIQSTGFFRNKARSLVGLGRALVERHGGRVPDTMEELTQLPGVGRKTAYVVLGNAFGKNEGIVVDTHVGRLAKRLGLTPKTTRSRASAT